MSLASDVLTLDVGGVTTIRVRRQVLTQFADSMLAARFLGRWEEGDTFFIDYSPSLFLPLVNYLRAKWVETTAGCNTEAAPTLATFQGNAELFGDFLRMVDYFGLVDDMYPIRLVPLGLDGEQQGDSIMSENSECASFIYVSTGINMQDTKMQRYAMQTAKPGYHVTSFQIVFDQCFHPGDADGLHFGLGWVDPRQLPTDSTSMDCFRPLGKDSFTGWYFSGPRLADGVITCNRDEITCAGVFRDENHDHHDCVAKTNLRKYRMKFSNIPANHVAVLGGIGTWRLVNVQMHRVEEQQAKAQQPTYSSQLNGDEEK